MTSNDENGVRTLSAIYSFLTDQGISFRLGSVPDSTFLPGIHLESGILVIDEEKLLYPGDILHEAGHWALMLPEKRTALSGNLVDDFPEDEGLEMGVLIWSYLAGKHIGLPPDLVFHPNGYKGDSDWLVEQFDNGTYIGLPLLEWMGIVEGTDETTGSPIVKKWLRG